MKQLFICMFGLVLLLPAQAPSGPRIECADATWEFGSVAQLQELKHEFVVRNVGKSNLRIKQVIPSCQCAAALPEKSNLKPGEETKIEVTLKTLTFKGRLEKVVTVVSDCAVRPQLKLNLRGEVLPPYYVKPACLSFGKFSKSDSSETIEFQIVKSPKSTVDIKEVVSSNKLLSVEAKGDPEKRADGSVAQRYSATVGAGANVGLMRENIVVLTDHKTLTKTIVPVTADVAGEVMLSLQNLNFGVCKPGDKKTKELVVSKSGAADLQISAVDVYPEGKFDAVVEELDKGRKFKVSVTLKEGAKPGYVKGSVNIRTNCAGEETVRAWFHAFIARK